MHKHNPDLIMALAEGSLSASEASTAGAEIAGCTECTADLEAQRVALGALRNAAAVRMTAGERAALHAGLRTELHLSDPEPEVVRSPSSRRRWSARWAFGGAAAVLVAVLAVAPALQLLSQGDSDDAGDLAAVGTTATTVAPSERAPEFSTEALPQAPAAEDDIRVAGDAADDGAGIVTTTTTAAETTTTAAPLQLVGVGTFQDVTGRYLFFFNRAAGDLPLAAELYAKDADETAPAPELTCEPPADLGIADDAEVYAVAVVVGGSGSDSAPAFVYRNRGSEDLLLVVFDAETCAVTDTLLYQP